ncbi:MAG TPA: hypothetical protein VGJ63_13000 [Micromonosporaceae bacterium]|jgi:hypothetical protein
MEPMQTPEPAGQAGPTPPPTPSTGSHVPAPRPPAEDGSLAESTAGAPPPAAEPPAADAAEGVETVPDESAGPAEPQGVLVEAELEPITDVAERDASDELATLAAPEVEREPEAEPEAEPAPEAEQVTEAEPAAGVLAEPEPEEERATSDAAEEPVEQSAVERDLVAAVVSLAPFRRRDYGTTRISLWTESSADELRARLRAAEPRFFDDPAAAVAEAQQVITDAVNALATTLSTALLQEQGVIGPGRGAESPDTEALRIAMRGYRDFLERLLAL